MCEPACDHGVTGVARDQQLVAIRASAEGLTDEQACNRPSRSALSIRGLVKHATYVMRSLTGDSRGPIRHGDNSSPNRTPGSQLPLFAAWASGHSQTTSTNPHGSTPRSRRSHGPADRSTSPTISPIAGATQSLPLKGWTSASHCWDR